MSMQMSCDSIPAISKRQGGTIRETLQKHGNTKSASRLLSNCAMLVGSRCPTGRSQGKTRLDVIYMNHDKVCHPPPSPVQYSSSPSYKVPIDQLRPPNPDVQAVQYAEDILTTHGIPIIPTGATAGPWTSDLRMIGVRPMQAIAHPAVTCRSIEGQMMSRTGRRVRGRSISSSSNALNPQGLRLEVPCGRCGGL
ncbi:uncharacterized protein MYCGRDRAFT_91928 [Zymoseptoria tritici IPO323]|uniref:Uncharacterized protein n=1 Tax=Zymoseptoria tritici (strain CBS 115943 / IPO323) TaxID=336722 RepID=F9X7X3_ZYMTI|nr:uncharacterized protein MYCGRDRAFT_91928 [Zymoseptoria tritici IPO323]EGP89280.1 hypothetical protein MYCGRDRAFT_91928 [Zymoseptoria tritici IPO323]